MTERDRKCGDCLNLSEFYACKADRARMSDSDRNHGCWRRHLRIFISLWSPAETAGVQFALGVNCVAMDVELRDGRNAVIAAVPTFSYRGHCAPSNDRLRCNHSTRQQVTSKSDHGAMIPTL